METIKIAPLAKPASRVCLGTRAIGGWMWGGTEEQESIETILKAFELGVNIVDTAPVYGFGKSEETAKAMLALLDSGKIRAIGVSNFSRKKDEDLSILFKSMKLTAGVK